MGGRRFPIVNTTAPYGPDAVTFMLHEYGVDMASWYFQQSDQQWQYGFRSRNGVTVHDFAEQFGGGGHPQASGCVLPEPVHVRVEAP